MPLPNPEEPAGSNPAPGALSPAASAGRCRASAAGAREDSSTPRCSTPVARPPLRAYAVHDKRSWSHYRTAALHPVHAIVGECRREATAVGVSAGDAAACSCERKGPMAGNGRNAGESVADKLFAVLDAFGGERTELTAAQICRLTDIPASTVGRLLRSLVEWGGITRTENGRYRVGVKLWEIATRFRVASDLRSAALPFMKDLVVATDAHVGLCVLEGDAGLIVDKFASSTVPSVGCVGGRMPLHASAFGKTLLAFGPPAFQEECLSKPMSRFTEKTMTSAAAIRREIAQVRLQRYAVCDEELVPGSLAVAAPVFGAEPGPVAAVGVVVARGLVTARELAFVVKAAASGISRGWQSLPPDEPRSITPAVVRRTTAGVEQYAAPRRLKAAWIRV